MEKLLQVFWTLIATPFEHTELIWGVVPLYFGWILNEVTSNKPSYQTAIQTGFGFLWAGCQWVYLDQIHHGWKGIRWESSHLMAVNLIVTIGVFVVGMLALWSGIRKRYPKGCSFLGHTRFSNYFMITLFPIQAGALTWSWSRASAILIFAVPAWLIIGLMMIPVRLRK